MLEGLDVKAASMYGRKLRKALDKKYGIRVLWKVSGWKANNRIVKWAGKEKLPFCVIDLVWQDNHTFGNRQKKIAIKRAKKVGKLIKKFKNTKWYVCPYLEPGKLDPKEYEDVIAECRKYLPDNVTMVSNAMEGYKVKGAIRAGHHNWYKEGMEIFSFDGIDCKDANINRWKEKAKNADMFLLWSYSMNGKYGPKDKRARRQRTSYVEIKELLSLQGLFDNAKSANLPNTWIYKPFAEQYAPPIPRGNKPVWIAPIKAPYIELRVNDKNIFSFKYEKPYGHGTGYIYRSLTWSCDILEKVKKYNKNGLADVYVGSQKIGKVHACQRVNKYQG